MAQLFSQTVEYALRARVWLARDPAQARTTREIARAARVPADCLATVMQALTRAGLLRSQRGLGGGFVLARPPRRAGILAVVNGVDPLERTHRRPLGLAEHGARQCPIDAALDAAAATIGKTFAEALLADFVGSKRRRGPVCDG